MTAVNPVQVGDSIVPATDVDDMLPVSHSNARYYRFLRYRAPHLALSLKLSIIPAPEDGSLLPRCMSMQLPCLPWTWREWDYPGGMIKPFAA